MSVIRKLRRYVEVVALAGAALVFGRAVLVEPFGVPTGSMAPTLLGHNRSLTCPRCGFPIHVGYREEGPADLRGAACPNCQYSDLHLEDVPPVRGDQVLVNKNVFSWRNPRRWEMAVFRGPQEPHKTYVKRVIGLPGESVRIRDGDIWVDGQLARKTLAQCRAVCMPVFDNNFQPAEESWAKCWETAPARAAGVVEGTQLRLDSRLAQGDYEWLIYRHWLIDENKAVPLTNEYAYNGAEGWHDAEPVHDFMLVCDVLVVEGAGSVAFTITDGADDLLVELPVGPGERSVQLVAVPRPGNNKEVSTPSGLLDDSTMVYRRAPTVHLTAGRKTRVELAFVDRRLSLALDGRAPFEPYDLPPALERHEVTRPVRIGARGVNLTLDNFRLLRDVHYTEVGKHGSKNTVALGAKEYFVLGDNSPNSDDSRFWSDDDGNFLAVRESQFIGKPILVHWPSRLVHVDLFGRQSVYQGFDWGRVRWLH
jgi:signal peptidase I